MEKQLHRKRQRGFSERKKERKNNTKKINNENKKHQREQYIEAKS